jgi:hypothetical protein
VHPHTFVTEKEALKNVYVMQIECSRIFNIKGGGYQEEEQEFG